MSDGRVSHPQTPCLVREAIAEDAAMIQQLYQELVADPQIQVRPQQVATINASSSSFLFVAEHEGRVCATALLTLCADAMYSTQPFGVVENVIVSQGMRGGGIGARLMGHLEQFAADHDCSKLMLLSSRARQEAHEFFRRCGFNGDTKQAFVKYRRQFGAA